MRRTFNERRKLGEEVVDLILVNVTHRAETPNEANEQEPGKDGALDGNVPSEALLALRGDPIFPFPLARPPDPEALRSLRELLCPPLLGLPERRDGPKREEPPGQGARPRWEGEGEGEEREGGVGGEREGRRRGGGGGQEAWPHEGHSNWSRSRKLRKKEEGYSMQELLESVSSVGSGLRREGREEDEGW